MQHKLGGNSKFDCRGNKYFIALNVYGRRETIEYPDRYTFLEALEYYQMFAKGKVLSHSNTDSTNVDVYTMIER